MPYAPVNSYALIGVEATKGTLSAALKSIPILSPQVTPQQKRLRDSGLRGSPWDPYGMVAGVRSDAYDLKGNCFADTFPIFMRAALGSTDTTTAAPTNTTLAASVAANSATISSTATIPVGSAIIIDTPGGAVMESHLTTAVTGAGPFTVTLSQPTRFAHNSGAAIAGLTAHRIGLQNDQVGSQPPSLSIQDFDGNAAFQLLACQLDEIEITIGAEEAFAYSAKFIGQPFTSIGNPATSFSAEVFIPAWSGQTTMSGTTSAVVQTGKFTLKRGTQAIWTQGQQGPHSIFAGPGNVEGDLTFVVESGDTTLTTGLATAAIPVIFNLTDPVSGHFVQFQMSAVQLQDPKRTRGKIFTEVETHFVAEGNATDAVTGGQSGLVCVTGNAQSTAY